MTPDTVSPNTPRPAFTVGQAVHVNAHAAWLPATVLAIGHTAVAISLHRPSAGPLTRTVAPWVVRPADGHRLEPVHGLRHGDEVVTGDERIHVVVGCPWQGRDGWWVLNYADGERATLPPGAVLRLTDDTPTVTVNARDLSGETWYQP